LKNLKGSNRKQKAWEKKRQETYLGSLMHFMRSVYRNTIMTEGFEVRHLQKVPNVEKQRVKARYRQMVSNGAGRQHRYRQRCKSDTGQCCLL
jgi:hypothetical protein